MSLPAGTRPAGPGPFHRTLAALRHGGTVLIGSGVLLAMLIVGLLAPHLGTIDPSAINPATRNRPPGFERTLRAEDGTTTRFVHRMGTDSLGRDVYSRVLYGARVSLLVGGCVAFLSTVIGGVIGLLAGYLRAFESIAMRVMDGLMAIPGILLAIAVTSLFRAGPAAVIVAVTLPEIPRAARLVRSVVLSLRHEPYVEAAILAGTRLPALLVRHLLPGTVAPLVVQATFVAASAILAEAILSFLGVGIPPEIPSWGNIMAEGRSLFRIYPHTIVWPGLFLTTTILAVNLLGDGLRDKLDRRSAAR